MGRPVVCRFLYARGELIIDCHTHIASRLTGFRQPLRYGKVTHQGQTVQWLPPSFDPPASPPEVLMGYMDQAGVDRACMVSHQGYGDQNTAILDAARRWPDRLVGFAFLPAITHPDAPDQLERLISAGMKGLKVELGTTRRQWPEFRFDGEAEWKVWERLDQIGRPLIIDANAGMPADTDAVRELISEFSHLRVAICHLGGPPSAGWQERALLAKHPRVWVDLTSVPGGALEPDPDYPFPEAQRIVQWAVDNVGAEKIMWGTDYPHALNRATYQQHLDFVRRHCTFLSTEQRAAILGGSAERFLNGNE